MMHSKMLSLQVRVVEYGRLQLFVSIDGIDYMIEGVTHIDVSKFNPAEVRIVHVQAVIDGIET